MAFRSIIIVALLAFLNTVDAGIIIRGHKTTSSIASVETVTIYGQCTSNPLTSLDPVPTSSCVAGEYGCEAAPSTTSTPDPIQSPSSSSLAVYSDPPPITSSFSSTTSSTSSADPITSSSSTACQPGEYGYGDCVPSTTSSVDPTSSSSSSSADPSTTSSACDEYGGCTSSTTSVDPVTTSSSTPPPTYGYSTPSSSSVDPQTTTSTSSCGPDAYGNYQYDCSPTSTTSVDPQPTSTCAPDAYGNYGYGCEPTSTSTYPEPTATCTPDAHGNYKRGEHHCKIPKTHTHPAKPIKTPKPTNPHGSLPQPILDVDATLGAVL